MGGTICRGRRKPEQVGRAILWLPFFITSRVMHAVDSAQEKLGRPVTAVEVFVELKRLYYMPIKSIYEIAAVLSSLVREEMLYTNEVGSHFTSRPYEGYLGYTDIFDKKFGEGYSLNSEQSVVPTTAKTVNLKSLLEILKSKDEKLFTDNKWIFDGEFRFLDNEPVN